MNVVALADGGTLVVGGFLDFVGKSLVHRHALAVAGVVHNPAHGQGFGTGRVHFQRHLVGGATYAAALHFHTGLGIFNGAGDHFQGINTVRAFVSHVDGGINNAFRKGALAIQHNLADQFANKSAVVTGVTTFDFSIDAFTAGHNI